MVDRLPAPELPGWLDEQVPFDRYTVEIENGLRVHVMEQGKGRPVVLFHGNPTWGYLYRRVAAKLTDEPLRLIMPDLVGLGFSDRPPSAADHTLENHSAWMASLLGTLGLSNAIGVVQDWGGAIGVHSMGQFPGLMTGLVVLNTMLSPPREGFKSTTFHKVFRTGFGQVATRLGLPQNYLGFAQGDRKSISGVVQKSYSYPLKTAQGGSDAVTGLVRMVPDSLEHPSVKLLGEVAVFVEDFQGPSAIVWGQKDPVLGKVLRRIKRALPDAEVTITDAGHFLQEEVPVEIAAAIKSVVARS